MTTRATRCSNLMGTALLLAFNANQQFQLSRRKDKMNQLAAANNTPVANISANPFEDYGNAASQRSIVGEMLKFSKGDFLVGQDNEEMAVGTQLVANMDELSVGWIRWQDNKPTDQIMGRIAAGYQPPKRNTLGDDDKTQWEVDEQGQQRDPWQFSNYLIMKEADGEELYTFATSSRGGLNAIGELCKSYGKLMRQKPDEFPLVALKVGSYQHSNKSFGRIKFPIFELVGWAPKTAFAEALAVESQANSGHGGNAIETPRQPEPAKPDPAAPPANTKTAATEKAAAAETRF